MGKVLRGIMADRNPVPLNDTRNIHQVWKAQVRLSDGSVTSAHIKVSNQEELLIEAVCALLGRHLGLNVPQPMFIQVPPSPISVSPAMAFGMESLSGMDVRHLVKIDQSITKRLLQWDGLPETVAFDELLANWDRHGGNIMYDGKTFHLIDHGRAFDQCAKKNNQMGDLMRDHNRVALQKTYALARRREPEYAAAPLESWLDEIGATPQAKTFVVDFLRDRADGVENLLRVRYGHGRLI